MSARAGGLFGLLSKPAPRLRSSSVMRAVRLASVYAAPRLTPTRVYRWVTCGAHDDGPCDVCAGLGRVLEPVAPAEVDDDERE